MQTTLLSQVEDALLVQHAATIVAIAITAGFKPRGPLASQAEGETVFVRRAMSDQPNIEVVLHFETIQTAGGSFDIHPSCQERWDKLHAVLHIAGRWDVLAEDPRARKAFVINVRRTTLKWLTDTPEKGYIAEGWDDISGQISSLF